MIHWHAFLEPELWVILGRMAWTLTGLVLNIFWLVMFCLAFWHGWSVSIGAEGSGFHIHFEQYPLRRFLQ